MKVKQDGDDGESCPSGLATVERPTASMTGRSARGMQICSHELLDTGGSTVMNFTGDWSSTAAAERVKEENGGRLGDLKTMAKHRDDQQLLAMLPPKQLRVHQRGSGENDHGGSSAKLLRGTCSPGYCSQLIPIFRLPFSPKT